MTSWGCILAHTTHTEKPQWERPSRGKQEGLRKLPFTSQSSANSICFMQVVLQVSLRYFTFLMFQILLSTCSSLEQVSKQLFLKEPWPPAFSHKHSKKKRKKKNTTHGELKLGVVFILISWCLRIQRDFLYCLLATTATKTNYVLSHPSSRKPIKRLHI